MHKSNGSKSHAYYTNSLKKISSSKIYESKTASKAFMSTRPLSENGEDTDMSKMRKFDLDSEIPLATE